MPVAALAPLLALILRRHLDSRQIILLAALCMLTMIYGLATWFGGIVAPCSYYFPFFFFALLLIAASVSLVERSGLSLLVKSVWVLPFRKLSVRLWQPVLLGRALGPEQAGTGRADGSGVDRMGAGRRTRGTD